MAISPLAKISPLIALTRIQSIANDPYLACASIACAAFSVARTSIPAWTKVPMPTALNAAS